APKMTTIDQEIRKSQDALIIELEKAGAVFKGKTVKCPFHDDLHPSGTIFTDHFDVWRFKCHACGWGGDIHDVRVQAEGGPLAKTVWVDGVNQEARPKAKTKPAPPKVYASLDEIEAMVKGQIHGEPIARYNYTNPDTSQADMIVLKFGLPDGSKTFRQCHPVESGVVLEAPPKPWPLYNRARVKTAETVIVVEGEKCVHHLHELDIVATTSPGGAGKAEHADWLPLAGKKVYIWPDLDEPGVSHMKMVIQQP
ncbi:hypothetical protein LCGC14_3046430, partial [marine sediment metagenome]